MTARSEIGKAMEHLADDIARGYMTAHNWTKDSLVTRFSHKASFKDEPLKMTNMVNVPSCSTFILGLHHLLPGLFRETGVKLRQASSCIEPLRDALMELNKLDLACAVAGRNASKDANGSDADQNQLEQRRKEAIMELGKISTASYYQTEIMTWEAYEEVAVRLLLTSRHALGLALLKSPDKIHRQRCGIKDKIERLDRFAEVCHHAKDLFAGGHGGWDLKLKSVKEKVPVTDENVDKHMT